MDWNEFNRELQNRVNDAGTRYCLGIVYERLLDIAKQQDMNNEILLQMAQTMQNFIGLNEAMDGKIKQLARAVRDEQMGVSVSSVPITNEED